MKRFKKICILLGILAVTCTATFVVTQVEEHKENIKNSDEIILEIPSSTVASLSWENETETLAFHKDEKWLYDEDEAFPVDEEKINELLSTFEAFGVAFVIEEVEDYGQYGLDTPVCTIDLTTEEQSYTIKLGDYSKMDSKRYVSVGDGNVYLAANDPLEQFDAVLSEMLAYDEIPSFDRVSGITFSGAEAYEITYEEDSTDTYCAEDVYFTQQEGTNLPLDTANVEAYLSNISYLGLTDYVSYNASEEELADYGLDSPELTVAVSYTEEDEQGEETEHTWVLNVSRDPEERKASEEAASEEETSEEETASEEVTAYAKVDGSQIVYQLSAEDYYSLMKASYDDLRHKEVLTADFADISKIDISLEDTVYTITSGQEEEERIYYFEGEELDVENLKAALQALQADCFVSEEPAQKEEISLTVYLEYENFPEVHIQLYRYDGTYCLAVVDGTPVCLVERASVVNLIEAVHEIVL